MDLGKLRDVWEQQLRKHQVEQPAPVQTHILDFSQRNYDSRSLVVRPGAYGDELTQSYIPHVLPPKGFVSAAPEPGDRGLTLFLGNEPNLPVTIGRLAEDYRNEVLYPEQYRKDAGADLPRQLLFEAEIPVPPQLPPQDVALEIDALNHWVPSQSEAEYRLERSRLPYSDEVGILHPQTHAGLLVHSNGSLDNFVVGHQGFRIDPSGQRFGLWAQTFVVQGGRLHAKFAYEVTEEIGRQFEMVVKKAAKVTADEDVTVASTKQNVSLSAAKALVLNGQEQLTSKTREHQEEAERWQVSATEEATLQSPVLELDTPVTAISIQGHPLDDKVLMTQEMWDEIQILKAQVAALAAQVSQLAAQGGNPS